MKLKKNLQNFLKKEKILVDIFMFGSALKSKKEPGDIDLVTLFREKNYEKIEEVNYQLKKKGDENKLKFHLEPIIVDNLHKEPVYLNLLHEGFSIKEMKFLSELLKLKAYFLITYSLKGKTASDKVRFSFALHGRKKNEGFLASLGGKEVGRGSVLVPVEKEELAKDFFQQWSINIKEQRVFVNY